MKNYPKLKLLLLVLSAILSLVFIIVACESSLQINKLQQETDLASLPVFSDSFMEISDVNGGDIYPGEILKALVKVINIGDMIIDSVAPRESKAFEILLKVVQDISRDTTGTCRLIINNGKLEEYGESQSLFIFGVGVYERDEIPIIGLHAIEEKIEIPIELSTFNFEVLCNDAVDFIASICSHIPIKNEQMVRYTGYYSNICRGRRKRQGTCESDFVIEEDNNKGLNKSWARLIKKVYEVDPLICPKCGGDMRIIAFIDDYKVVRKILDYLGIDEFKKRDRTPPKTLAVADSFDDYAQNDYIDCDYVDF